MYCQISEINAGFSKYLREFALAMAGGWGDKTVESAWSMSAFDSVQILEMTLSEVGNNAMWDAALRILPAEQGDRESPIIARVTDRKGNQVCITRINGIPVLVAASIPHRFSGAALEFQRRWQATPADRQSTIPNNV